jgi:hypothetical protein
VITNKGGNMYLYVNIPVCILERDIPTLRLVCNEIRSKHGFPYSIDHSSEFESSSILVRSMFDNRPLSRSVPELYVGKHRLKDRITRAQRWINSRPPRTYDFIVVIASTIFLNILTKEKEIELFQYHVVDNRVPRTTPFYSASYNLSSVLKVDAQLLELHDWLRYDHKLDIVVYDSHWSITVRRHGLSPCTTVETKDLKYRVSDVTVNNRVEPLERNPPYSTLVSVVDTHIDQIKAQVLLTSGEVWRRIGNVYLIAGLLPELIRKIVYLSLFSHGLK